MNYQMQIPPLTKINKIFIIISAFFFVIGSILYAWMKVPVGVYFGLSLEGMMSGRIYQLVSYPFWQGGLMSFIFQSLILWWTGSELEQRWGQRFYLVFVVSTIVISGFLFLLLSFVLNYSGLMIGSSMVGMSGVTLALLFSYAMLFPERQFSFFMLFPMQAKYFCLLLAGIEVYQILFSPFGSSLWGHLLGGLWGASLIKFMARSPSNGKKSRSQIQAEALRKRFKIISSDKDDKNDGPKYWH